MSASAGRSGRHRLRALIGLCIVAVALTTACDSSPGADDPAPAAPPTSDSAPSSPMPDSMPDATSGPSAGPSSAPDDAPSTAAALITIKDFVFEVPAEVAAGATITVVNEDSMSHTVTATPGGAFDVTVAGGATGTFTAPNEPGSYDFVCSFHGNMTGTLVVT